jgi:hypothetical protein
MYSAEGKKVNPYKDKKYELAKKKSGSTNRDTDFPNNSKPNIPTIPISLASDL